MEKSILITGSSSGIGLTAALTLKERGYRVFATARKPEDVKKLLDLNLEALTLDVTDSTQMKQVLDTILARTNGTLDAVFNNAGYVQVGAIEDLEREIVLDQFKTNVFGTMELTRLVLPIMHAQGHGRIIQNSSILGIVALPFYGAYNASKFALEGFNQTLRLELAGSNIYVSLLDPGPIATNIRDNAFKMFKQTLAKYKQQSRYESVYDRMETNYFQSNRQKEFLTLHPDVLVKRLLHALESPKPKLHYYIGGPAKLLQTLRRILPDFALNWVLAKIK